MKKIVAYLFASVLFVGSFSSCASVQVLPQNVSKIYVESFKNSTNRFGLEPEFKNEVIDEIVNDGRLSLVDNKEQADGVLNATINEYILQPLTYDDNGVVENYRMSVAVSVSLDRDDGSPLWSDSNLEVSQIYDISREDFENDEMSKKEAMNAIWAKMSKNIVRKIVKVFGSVKSISEKKVVENSNQ